MSNAVGFECCCSIVALHAKCTPASSERCPRSPDEGFATLDYHRKEIMRGQSLCVAFFIRLNPGDFRVLAIIEPVLLSL